MTIEERTKIALNVINCTLAIDDLPLEILNRLSTLYVLLDEDAEAEETAIAKEFQYSSTFGVNTIIIRL